jgi:hypothetical protein
MAAVPDRWTPSSPAGRAANAAVPLDAASLAIRFRQGRRAGPKIASVLGALLRMGFVASPDGGGKFSLRRAA